MTGDVEDSRVRRRLIEAFYTEAMVLADEARDYFDIAGRLDRDRLDPLLRVAFSCESLKVTTMLMHVIAWLLTQRAVDAGELEPRDALDPSRRLGAPAAFDPDLADILPDRARTLVTASADLYRRVERLDLAQAAIAPVVSPVQSLHARLSTAF